MERGIQAQACDRGDRTATHGLEEQQGGEPAVGHHNEIPLRQPAARLEG
jgi:hypothetical protein